MEAETMVFSDDDLTTHTSLNKRRPSQQQDRCRFNKIHLGFGCLGIVFLTIVIAVTILASVPNVRKSIIVTEKREDNQEIVLKAMFSTNHAQNNESESFNIINVDDMTNQLNMKLNGNKILIVGAAFRDQSSSNEYYQMTCENALFGNALQLNIVAFYPRQCASQDENICKIQFQEQLKNILDKLLIIPMTIQFSKNRFKKIDIKICNLIEITEEDNDEKITAKALIRKRKGKITTSSVTMPTKVEKNIDMNTPFMLLAKSLCTMNVGRIVLVQMAGAYGTRIHDDTRLNEISNNDQYEQHLTVTLYEDMTYRLHIQFNCNGQSNRDLLGNICDLSQDVNVWIDFNDNGFDDDESRLLHDTRSDNNNNIPGNTIDLELYIPAIDRSNTRTGLHRMRLTVIPNEEYQRECGTTEHKETREYTVNIVPKSTYPAIPDISPPDVIHRNSICSQNIGKISLVIMAGERGTEIRDDNPPAIDSSLYNYANRHHLAVTIYEHTVYLLRVQLDCSWQLNSELFDHGCNLAQDVSVWIDLNGDGRYDESELGTPYRWPVTSYMPQGNYDLQLYVPLLDDRYLRTGKHQMRLVVTSSDYYRRTCGRTDYNETRDYTVNIIPRTGYVDTTEVAVPYVALDNIACSPHVGKIILVIIAGEHRTQIRDDSSTRAVLNSDSLNQQQQAIVLYEGTVYLSRIQLDCSRQWRSDFTDYNCHLIYDVNVWIDLNDDGIFDSSENAAPFRWPLNSYTPKGIYDLQLSIPVIDGQRVRTGPHRMQLVVTMSEHYHRKCGDNEYKETREYTVSIVPNTRPAADPKIPFLQLSDNVCTLNNAKMALVIMAGEQGTEIRDNILTNTVLPENQNRHHLSVTLHEGTIYRLRVTLDCHPRPSGGLPDINCNLAQDVNVYIDLNNDERFDETESRVPHRWPLRNAMLLGIYDFEIEIPVIDRQHIKSGPHRMRIVVIPSDEYNKKCGRTDHRETREYTINIIPKVAYRELEYRHPIEPKIYPVEHRVYPTEPRVYPVADSRVTYCSIGNLVCSEASNGISLVSLFGEQGTQIRDELKICNAENNYNDRSNLAVTLFDSTVYTLRIELYCVQGQNYDNICNHPQYVGVWIDFNNDGIFDDNSGEMISNNWHEDGQRTNTYDLRIIVPQTDRGYYVNEQHRMRIILTQDERNLKACFSAGYGEARDYTIQIIPKPTY